MRLPAQLQALPDLIEAFQAKRIAVRILETLVLYRTRPIPRRQVGSGGRAGAGPIQLFEGSRR